MLLEYEIVEPSKSPWAYGIVMTKNQKERRTATILLRLSLHERGYHKGRLPNSTHRREPLETW